MNEIVTARKKTFSLKMKNKLNINYPKEYKSVFKLIKGFIMGLIFCQ